MNDETRKLLRKAERAIHASEALLHAGHADFAVSRCYYVMLYAADALLCERGLRIAEHAGAHAAFEQHFTRCGLIDPGYHRRLVETFDIRLTADYDTDAAFTREQAAGVIEQARDFLAEARRFLEHIEPERRWRMSHTVERVDLYLARLPLVRPFTTSSHTKDHMEHILVRLRTADGAEGWGECASPSDPYYCAETVETCWHMLRDFLAPVLVGRTWDHPEPVGGFWAKVRGNNFAKAGIEMACWDLAARAQGVSVARMLGGAEARPAIESGISLGIEATPALLVERVDEAVAAGYKRVKVKIGPDHDVEYIAAVRAKYPDLPLMADANSVYTLADAPVLRELDRFNLMMIEQPLGDDDIVDHASLQRELRTPICLDESIYSVDDCRKALDLDAGRIINIKVSRLGGLAEAKRVHDLCRARGIPVWCGGMHEFGVGRAANIAINSLPGFTLPGDISSSDERYREDLVEPPVRARQGIMPVPLDRPGLGHDLVESRLRAALVREESVSRGSRVAVG